MLDSSTGRRGVRLRPGSLREARSAAGLSLAGVAAGRVTRNAIHLFEAGKARPTRDVLAWIAQQTGRPIEFFLDDTPEEPGVDVDQTLTSIASLIAQRQFSEATTRARALLEQRPPHDLEATAELYLGEALCCELDHKSALPHLRSARATFEKTGDQLLAVEALDWEAVALYIQEDPAAIPLLEEAWARLNGMTAPPGLRARLMTHLGAMHAKRHDWRRAAACYERAVEVAEALLDLRQVAQIHDGLAHAYQEMHFPAKALSHAHRALALFSMQADLRARARAHNNLGDVYLRQGDFARAEVQFRLALAGSDLAKPEPHGQGYMIANLAEAALRQGRLEEATARAREAIGLGEQTGESFVAASGHRVLAEAAEKTHDTGTADEHFGRVFELLASAGGQRLCDAHIAYAQVLKLRGDIVRAAEHWEAAALLGRDLTLGVASLDEHESNFYASTG